MNNTTSLQFLVLIGFKKPKKILAYDTVIKIDNTRGGEDLVELTLYYSQYGTFDTKTKLLSNKVKAGKSAEFKLDAGSNPAAFFLLWKANNFFRWIGDGTDVSTILTEIEANWRVDEVDGLRIWGGGFFASGVKP